MCASVTRWQARQIVDRHDASSNEKSRSTRACLRHLVLGGYAYPSPLLPLNRRRFKRTNIHSKIKTQQIDAVNATIVADLTSAVV
jgi:hypothetical protein